MLVICKWEGDDIFVEGGFCSASQMTITLTVSDVCMRSDTWKCVVDYHCLLAGAWKVRALLLLQLINIT